MDGRNWSKETVDATRSLGSAIALGRHGRTWTLRDLAERTGVSVPTMRNVERGEPTVAIGTYLEAARLVGLHLFGAHDRFESAALADQLAAQLRLLPERVRHPSDPDDEF